MAKFQNISGFRQYVTINGKKTIVGNNQVFEKEEGFVQHGFQRVPDDTPVTVVEGTSRLGRMTPIPDTLEMLQRKIQTMESNVGKATDEDFDRINEQLNTMSQETTQEVSELKGVVEDMMVEMKETRESLEGFQEQVKKRMEIIKIAINVIEGEMDQLYDKGILDLPQEEDPGN